MKTSYYANRDIIDPKKCYGIVKIEHGDDGEMSAGYYYDGHEWIRDDKRAVNKAYGENIDYMEIEESELEQCMESKRDLTEDAEERKANGEPGIIRE